ncbi:MAG: long-chain fatty acid--CoA ligase [Pirellulaceae bacterium]
MISGETLPQLFGERVQRDGHRPALYVREAGTYEGRTWDELGEQARRLAAGLVRCGVQPGDRVVQFSENRYEWIVVDMAILWARAVHVPLHAPLTGPQAAYQIADSGAKVVFLSTAAQAEKLRQLDPAIAAQLPRDLHYFTFSQALAPIGGQPVQPWVELWEATPDGESRQVVRAGVQATRPADLATILYTSGTTGEPKGVMLTQQNLTTNACATVERFAMRDEDRRLCFLPLSHIFARLADLYTWCLAGYEMALAESRETVLDDCRDYRPTLLNGVPYFYDRTRRLVIERGEEDHPDGLRRALGGAIRACNSGGAPLPDHVFDFYWQRHVPLLQGYGLTETSPVIALSTPEHYRRGSSGRPIRGVEVRIAEDGEIQTRGPHVMIGYYHKPAATAEVLRDGWFSTGDLGRLDEDGYLFITGRKKELLITSGGKKVAAVYLESLLTEDPLILQAVVVGDGRDYLVALIVPNPDLLRQEIMTRGIAVTSREEALSHPQVLELFERRIHHRLRSVSYYEQIRRFRLMNRGFTIESGELTPKLSLRRKQIEANCCDLIEAMYQKEGAPFPDQPAANPVASA